MGREDYRLAMTIENNQWDHLIVNIEPLAEDYCLLPGQIAEIWQSTSDEESSRAVSPKVIFAENSVTIYEFFDYRVEVDGLQVECGYQRNIWGTSEVEFEIEFPDTASELFRLLESKKALSKVLDTEIERYFDRKWTFRSKNGDWQWRLVYAVRYSKMRWVWRSKNIPGTVPDAHIGMELESTMYGTKMSVFLSDFGDERLKREARSFWETRLLDKLRELMELQDI